MKTTCLALFASVALLTLPAQSAITDVTYQADGDGGVVCPSYQWPGGDSVSVYGDQYCQPGHILFNVSTDTEQDPTLALLNAIDNDTGFAWTGYEVDIWMNKTFSISGPTVLLPPSWSVSSVDQPVLGTAYQDGVAIPNVYIGKLFFSGSSPIAVGGTLEFAFSISFSGSASFTEQLVPVPEPSLGFLGIGAILGVVTILRRKS